MNLIKRIRYIITLLLISLAFVTVSAQDGPKAMIDGKVSNSAGKKLGGASIVVKKNGAVINTFTSSSNGKYPTVELPMGHNYTITVSLGGYVTKEIALDTKTGYFEEDSPDVIPLDIPFELNEMKPDVDYSAVSDGFQIGKLTIDPKTNGLAIDYGFTSKQKSKYDKFFKDLEEKANADEENFNKLVSEGDKATQSGNFSMALTKYEEALKLKEGDPGVTGKVTETKKQIEIKKNFDKAVSDGDGMLSAKNYDQAIAKYEAAKALMPSDKNIDAKIKEAQDKKAADASAEIDQKYAAKIKEAKSAFDSKDYAFAKTLYGEAGEIKPSEKEPPAKIAEIDKIIKDELEKDKQYAELVAAGNKGMLTEDYDVAITKFEEALKIKKESSVETELAKARDLKAKKEAAEADAAAAAAKQAEFDGFIAAGEGKQSGEDYDGAIAQYEKALALNVDNPTANSKIQGAKDAKKAAEDAAKAEADAAAAAAKQAEFDGFIAAGEGKQSGEDYDGAIAQYEKALALNVDNPTANSKIQGAKDAKKAAEDAAKAEADAAAAAAKQAGFDGFIAAGEGKQSSEDYDGAIAQYEKALALNVDNPTANSKIQSAKDAKKAAEDAANEVALAAEKQAKFDEFIAAGDGSLSSEDFDGAIAKYQSALALDVNNPKANEKIQAAKDQKAAYEAKLGEEAAAKLAAEKQAKFDEFITAGDVSLSSEDFDGAIAKYQSALALDVNNPKANEKIQEAKDQKAAYEAKLGEEAAAKLAAEKQAKFDEFITAGDGNLSSEDFEGAIAKYQSALALDVNNPKANEKIQEAKDQKAAYEAKLGEEAAAKLAAEKQAKFDEFITAGDGSLSSEDFSGAISKYESALALDVNNPKANEKIQLAKDKKAAFDEAQNASNAEAELDAEFNKLIADGDAAKNAKDWEKAKDFYSQANVKKPSSPLPQKKIDEVNALMAQQLKGEQDELFNKIMAKANELSDDGEYDKAIGLCEKAKTNFPGKTEPDALINKINGIIASNAAKEEQYNKLISSADGLFESSKWQAAKEDYLKAKAIFDRPRPNEQIAIIDKKIAEEGNKDKEAEELAAKQAKYDALMKKAKGQKDAKSYTEAIKTYTEAKGVLPSESEPQSRIDEINKILNENAGKEELMAKYNAAIQKADAKRDKAYNQENESLVAEAKDLYTAANKIKADETYPQEQVNKLNNFLKELADKEGEAQYQRIIDKADELFEAKSWDGAEKLYKRAISFKAADPYPPAQLKKIKLARENAGKNDQYQIMIAEADEMFDNADYYNSKSTYEKASALMPKVVYPKKRIEEINALLEKQKQDAAEVSAVNNTVKKDPNYMGEKVTGMTELEMQQLLEKGRLDEIEGNDVIIANRKTDRLSFEDLEKDMQLSRSETEQSDLIRMQSERFELENSWDDQRLENIPNVESYKEGELGKIQGFKDVEEGRSYGIDRYNNTSDLERSELQNSWDEQRENNVPNMESYKEGELSKVQDFRDVEEERSFNIDVYNNTSELKRSAVENARDIQREANIVDMVVVKERELSITNNWVDESRDVTYDTYKSNELLTAKYETFADNGDFRRREETVAAVDAYKFEQEKLSRSDQEYFTDKTDNLNKYNTEMTAKFENFAQDSDIPREKNIEAMEIYQEELYNNKMNEVTSYTEKSQNTYMKSEQVKEEQFKIPSEEDLMRERNIDEMSDFQEAKLQKDGNEADGHNQSGYDKSLEYNDVKTQKATMFSDENVDPLANQYTEGITEEMYQRKNNMGEVIEVTIVRTVVNGNKADQYKKVTSRWTTNYFKNGGVITQHIWDTETH